MVATWSSQLSRFIDPCPSALMDTASNRFKKFKVSFAEGSKGRTERDGTVFRVRLLRQCRGLWVNMNETEAKIEKTNSPNAVPSTAWQGNDSVIAAIAGTVDFSLRSIRYAAEVQAINCALQQTGGNRKRAAKLLSISYRSLLYKIRQHNITPVMHHS